MNVYGKINWALEITGVREDGYHLLDMLMQRIELCDVLEAEKSNALSLSVDGGEPIADEKNLVLRAARALQIHTGTAYGARIRLKKNIPSRAGLGGGSADAAAALVLLNDLWALGLNTDELAGLGLKLGADVPFCLSNEPARVSGIGENVNREPSLPQIPLAMITPGGGLSTPEVYRAWDALGGSKVVPDMQGLIAALCKGRLREAAACAGNALWLPALKLMPELSDVKRGFEALGSPFVFMTGSGSTVVAAFDSDEEAQRAAAAVPGAVFTRTVGVKKTVDF